MHAPMFTAAVLVGAFALQVSASAPRCKFQYLERKGLQAPSGCPAGETKWTHCCLVPMSNYDREHPTAGQYMGACAVDPMIKEGEPDICRPLNDRHYNWHP
ncbi:hypothetical protein NDA13_002854 [Ustilago tritici]|nr:hypothetical protein NDA13_002854 [Ustilago tritici]